MTHRRIAALAVLALLLAACGGDERRGNVAQLFPGTDTRGIADQVVGATRTVNVYVSEAGYDPPAVQMWVGEGIELVFRNIGREEYHYKVDGMSARDLFWLDQDLVDYTADAPAAAASGASGASGASAGHEHEHGAGGLVPIPITRSRGGVERWGDEVHAWAYPGKLDVIVFTPTKAGTYTVKDPLHPKLSGRVVVNPAP